MWVVSFMSQPFHPHGKGLRNLIDMKPCRLKNLAERSRKLRNTFPQEEKEVGGGGG
jgi:hypothetical protein